MSHVFPRHTKSELPVIASGDGVYLIDELGKRYIDGSCGAATSCLGHSNAKVIQAIKSQLDSVAYAHTGFFTSQSAEELADKLIAHAPKGIKKAYLVSGGSEAVEAALKLARQYFIEKGEGSRRHIIARKQSYHGNTLGALAAGGNQWRRRQFEPLLVETSLISPCYAWRYQRDHESEEDYGLRVANELEDEILRLGPEQVMAFLAEPVVGATAGALCPVPGYLARIREICDQYGVLLIFDEVMCGMGRTGALFAGDVDGVTPDIVAIAKGLGAGYQPIGAMLCQDYIHDAIEHGSGFFQHGHTYLGHPIAAAAANAVLDRLVVDGLVDDVAQKGEYLKLQLKEKLGQHPHIGNIRGRGLFIGIEFVASQDDKTPFDPALNVAGNLKKNAFQSGLVCYPAQGTIDGRTGDHVLLAPPFIINNDEMDMLVDRLALAVDMTI